MVVPIQKKKWTIKSCISQQPTIKTNKQIHIYYSILDQYNSLSSLIISQIFMPGYRSIYQGGSYFLLYIKMLNSWTLHISKCLVLSQMQHNSHHVFSSGGFSRGKKCGHHNNILIGQESSGTASV